MNRIPSAIPITVVRLSFESAAQLPSTDVAAIIRDLVSGDLAYQADAASA